MTPRGVLAFCREKEVRVVDLRFTDIMGKWHHVTIPVRQLTEATFESGYRIDACQMMLDGNSNRLVIPLPTTAFLDSFATTPTLIMICTIQDALTRDDDPFDPRVIAQRAVNFLASTGIADEARIGPQCDFSWFQSKQFTSYNMGTRSWNGPSSNTTGYNVDPVETCDSDFGYQARNEITEALEDVGFPIAMHQQINSSGSKCRIDFVGLDLIRAGDAVMTLKHVARRVAERLDRHVTFMPKPISDDCGASLISHLSLWKNGEPIFGGQSYGGLSETAMMAIGGILSHRKSLSAICNPSTNSYRRLNSINGPLFQSGYSNTLRQSACRVPSHSTDPKSKRIEVCFADPSANPYLAFAAILMAAIDGIQNKIDPGKPLEKITVGKADSGHSLTEAAFPKSLWESLQCLTQDQAYLFEGDVFSSSMVERWIAHKQQFERDALESHATPSEYFHYFDC